MADPMRGSAGRRALGATRGAIISLVTLRTLGPALYAATRDPVRVLRTP